MHCCCTVLRIFGESIGEQGVYLCLVTLSNRTHSRPKPPFQNGKYPLTTLDLLGLGARFLDIMEIGTARRCSELAAYLEHGGKQS